MKHIFVPLFIVAFLLSSGNLANAETIQPNNSGAEEQIRILLDKIAYLQSLIAKLMSEREILAESYMVVDLSDGNIILEKNINQQHSIASITKLMNAVVVSENINSNQSIVLTSQMLRPYGYSPSLFLGLNVSAQNLLKASLIQ